MTVYLSAMAARFGQVLADLQFGIFRLDWLERSANFFAGVGLHVVHVGLGRAAVQPDEQHLLRPRAARQCGGLGTLRLRAEHVAPGKAKQAGASELKETPAIMEPLERRATEFHDQTPGAKRWPQLD
jgi:hypothetical protein